VSGVGRYLEVSIPTKDILESLSFYKNLGFREVQTGDMWAHKYAVVTDGLLHIGLHELDEMPRSITFVQQDLAKHARSMADHGFNFDTMQLDEDVFNEITVIDTDGHRLRMVEARTFNVDADDDDDSALGTLFEITLPVKDALQAARFWGPVTQVVEQLRETPTVHMRFDAGGIPLGLSESIALSVPSLCFRVSNPVRLTALIERGRLNHRDYPGFEGANCMIVSPEGTPLYVFDEDFLGEKIEVVEAEDADDFPVDPSTIRSG
jgi:catechol 2,3-dioxygenase-like lactoylglutathione lyase family enzyme